jgi:hypothetical protein
MTIEQNLARYRELDKARTQGEWRHERTGTYQDNVYHPDRHGEIHAIKTNDDYDYVAECVHSKDDGNFIAAAPSILRDLETAVDVIRALRGAIGNITYEDGGKHYIDMYGDSDVTDIIAPALALAAKKMGA